MIFYYWTIGPVEPEEIPEQIEDNVQNAAPFPSTPLDSNLNVRLEGKTFRLHSK